MENVKHADFLILKNIVIFLSEFLGTLYISGKEKTLGGGGGIKTTHMNISNINTRMKSSLYQHI